MTEIQLRDGVLFLEGDLSREDVATFQARLPALLRDTATLDCSALDIEDGAALACLARLLKDAAATRRITIHGAPQLLAHTLYRVGALKHFDWPGMRWDEASTQ